MNLNDILPGPPCAVNPFEARSKWYFCLVVSPLEIRE